jgi:hypothetical protein
MSLNMDPHPLAPWNVDWLQLYKNISPGLE